jgi:hypothetical protein
MPQFQFFGRGNTQIFQSSDQSFSAVLIEQGDALKERDFHSQDVKDFFIERLDYIIQKINDSYQHTLRVSRYVIFPFKPIGKNENLSNQAFICNLLDTLAVIAFSESNLTVLENYLNVSLNNKKTFGIYYTDGQLTLKDAFVRILRDMDRNKVMLPSNFVCIPLSTSGSFTLEENKIENVITDISGDSAFIKPLDRGTPKCVSLCSYVINEAASIQDAKTIIMGALGIEQ